MPQRLRSNQKIVGADRLSDGFQSRSDASRNSRILWFKIQQTNRTGEESLDRSRVGFGTRTLGDPGPELKSDH